jgi:hypothetical protein
MTKPAGVARATKDNSKKHPQQRDEWMRGKKIGRRKQVWVEEFVSTSAPAGAEVRSVDLSQGSLGHGTGIISGHWEKIR